uniref:BAH domain-containing protein n=1 Tax=Tetradesmus obliquus TaxID=3088 RepID=A0A383V3Y4_TETOB|eukprot:jgi/Sobl393_1/2939/SZX59429.1
MSCAPLASGSSRFDLGVWRGLDDIRDKITVPVGRVLRIASSGSSGTSLRLRVNWLYRPEEAEGGRKSFYGQQELLASDHIDDGIPIASALGCCRVHALQQYMQLRDEGKLTDADFYSRYLYKSDARTFEPEMVPVHCLCELPFNPEKPMSQCSACGEWYHHECLLQQYGPSSLPAATAAAIADPQQQQLQQQHQQLQQHESSWMCPLCSRALHDTQQQQQQQQQQQLEVQSAMGSAVTQHAQQAWPQDLWPAVK